MKTGEFDWDRQLRGTLSSSFFWGYVATQFVGGWLAVKYVDTIRYILILVILIHNVFYKSVCIY